MQLVAALKVSSISSAVLFGGGIHDEA